MLVESRLIKDIIMEHLQKARKNIMIPGLKKSVVDQHEGVIRAFETLIISLTQAEKKGDPTMEDVKIAIGEIVNFDDVAPQTRGGIDQTIIEAADKIKDLEPGKGVRMELKDATWNSFSNRVYFLRKQKVIPSAIVPRNVKRGNGAGVYLVKEKPEPKG